MGTFNPTVTSQPTRTQAPTFHPTVTDQPTTPMKPENCKLCDAEGSFTNNSFRAAEWEYASCEEAAAYVYVSMRKRLPTMPGAFVRVMSHPPVSNRRIPPKWV